MARNQFEIALLTCALALLGGCDLEIDDDEVLDEDGLVMRDDHTFKWGPIGLNNRSHLAAHYDLGAIGGAGSGELDDSKLLSVTLHVNGIPYVLDKLWVTDGRLHGLSGTTQLSGSDFVSSQWTTYLKADGKWNPHPQVITGFSAGYTSGDIYIPDVYELRFESSGDLVCETGPDGNGYAMALGNLYLDGDGTVDDRSDTLMFGCVWGGAAKAVLWGYGPDRIGKDGYQTAVRMVIGDYCGDGTSYTTTGLGVAMRDTWNVHGTSPVGIPTEAGWDPDGATCLTDLRNEALTLADIPCANLLPTCPTDPFTDGSLIWTWDWDAGDL